MEARAGIEPAYTDLQSAASPLRHRASIADLRGFGAPRREKFAVQSLYMSHCRLFSHSHSYPSSGPCLPVVLVDARCMCYRVGMETVRDRSARLFAEAAAVEAERINAMLAEHSKFGRLRSGVTIQRAVAIVGEATNDALMTALNGIAKRAESRGRLWRSMIGEVEIELSAHLDAAPTRIHKMLQMIPDGERLAEPLFQTIKQDMSNRVIEYREGWVAPMGRGWHERHPIVYAIALVILGAIVGQAVEKSADYALASPAESVGDVPAQAQ